MSVIVGMSAKGSPGVSLGVWGLLHCWTREAVGLEADLSGGSWALTHGGTCDPGLSDLAAEQGPITEDAVARCSTEIGVGKRLVCAPREPVHVRRALEWLSDRLAGWPEDLDVVADVGRVDPTIGHPLLQRADAVIVWTHTTPVGLGSAAALIEGLDRVTRTDVLVRVVTVGESPYTPTESVEALRDFSGPRLTVQLGAALPNDPRLAQLLAGGGRKAGRVCSSWFGPLATELATSTAYRSTPTLGRTAALSTSGGAR